MKMMSNDNLGDRMKAYEHKTKYFMTPKKPVILRLDGKAFHTYTKDMVRPYDKRLAFAMHETTKFLCEKIGDCRFAYTQSDEITLVLTNDKSIDYSPWFNNQIQKIVSIASSLCTFKFNDIMYKQTGKIALFDCRAFTVPDYIEAANCVFWRQLDAKRNSIQMLAQSLYSHNELQGLSCYSLESKIAIEYNINWQNLDTWKKWGVACRKQSSGWVLDYNIPLFKENWAYLYDVLKTEYSED